MNSALLVAPSILSADLRQLGAEIAEVEEAGADWIHVDVMDGQYVPNITVGLPVVKAVRQSTKLPIDVHLMIETPERYLSAFADAGADVISVHIEACAHLHRALAEIRRLGMRAGVALNPQTPEGGLQYVIDEVDLILVMSVNPGFSGQSFIPSALNKIRAIRAMVDEAGRAVDIEVDGGVDPDTVGGVRAAGATVVVAGNSVFGQPNRRSAIAALRAAAE